VLAYKYKTMRVPTLIPQKKNPESCYTIFYVHLFAQSKVDPAARKVRYLIFVLRDHVPS
jgi:hypothetical protein